MTLNIDYKPDYADHRGWTMFDIEYWQYRSDYSDNWYSEIKILPIVEGITRFVYDQTDSTNFDVEQFIQDAEKISELRRWLWEVDGNRDISRHYRERLDYIKITIKEFIKKYNLQLNED